jgi:quinol-cytochrome oxidoreductase complex cytochrome b subunit
LLPLIVGLLVIVHVILVRRHGVVPPIGAEPPEPRAALAEAELPHEAVAAPTEVTTPADTGRVPR